MSQGQARKPISTNEEAKIKEDQGYSLELEFVKSTYDAIAEDFSSTRYKKWPRVDAFLRTLPTSNLLLDVGCGNGKYLDNRGTYNIGCDLSQNLLKICKARGFEVVLCDMTRLPFRQSVFDSVISIAALHHLTTARRRQNCLSQLIHLMNPEDSLCLIQVWSFEQELGKDNPYLKSDSTFPGSSISPPSNIFKIDGDLELPIHKNRTPFQEQDVLVPFNSKSTNSNQNDPSVSTRTRLRYYHVFREGELDEMFQQVPDIEILQSYYDKGNWSVIACKGRAISRSKIAAEFTWTGEGIAPVSAFK